MAAEAAAREKGTGKRGHVNCVCLSRRPSVRRERGMALELKALFVYGIMVSGGATDIG